MQALAHPCVFPIALRALVALFPLFGVYDGFIVTNAGGGVLGARADLLGSVVQLLHQLLKLLRSRAHLVQRCSSWTSWSDIAGLNLLIMT